MLAMVIVLLVLPSVLYVASIGPAAKLVVDDQISMGTYDMIYAPILKAAPLSTAPGYWLQEYRELFVDNEDWLSADIAWHDYY
jgi:hypothetical protein